MFKNALISCSDKSGLREFVVGLQSKDIRVVSSGGTARFLRDASLEVLDVSEQTGFPEVMDGRVKTLHPNIHMGLLARQGNSEDQETLKKFGVSEFDLVVVNLYPFQEALAKRLPETEMIENIDIGGPSMLRAAAKNFERIAVVCDPSDYSWILEKQELTLEDRKFLAAKVFAHTSHYDSLITNYLGDIPNYHSIAASDPKKLRYGENPHQQAIWYRDSSSTHSWKDAEILQGKELSYNNLLDLEAALRALKSFTDPCVVSVKHNNPCGVGLGANMAEAVKRSLAADPVSVFGGIIALNQEVDEDSAEQLSKLFLECIVAPCFSSGALDILKKKKNLRCLQWPEMLNGKSYKELKRIEGGYLLQDQDSVELEENNWVYHGEKPSAERMEHLKFAWKVCAHLKSNAIAITTNKESVGLGMGQVNRVDAVEQAIKRTKDHHGDKSDFVLASDAFFPFADSIERIAEAGIQWVIQPGGSIKDNEVIEMAQKKGVNLVFTGRRHFRH